MDISDDIKSGLEIFFIKHASEALPIAFAKTEHGKTIIKSKANK